MRRALLISLVLLVVSFAPIRAFAAQGTYSIDELSTEVVAETNGTAHVIERQIYTFDDDCRGCIWYLHVPESGESVRISNIRVAPVDDGGTLIGEWTRLQSIDVNRRTQGENPGDTAAASLRTPNVQPWYSYSIGDGMIRCYFPTDIDDSIGPSIAGATAPASTRTDQTDTYLIETDYTITHRVRVYSDVAELYWRYANSSLPASAHNVSLHVTLPLPADDNGITPGEAILAWGHGPDAGTFEIGGDGSVTYFVDQIERGNYAEAHIVFPSSWVSDVEPNAANLFSGVRRSTAIAEEAQWVDSGMRGEAWDNKVRVLFLGIAVLVILAGVASVLRNGRSPQSRRALVRVATTLAITGAGEHLFFHEPLTTGMLAAGALIVGFVALFLPACNEVTESEKGKDTAPAKQKSDPLRQEDP